MADQMKAWNAFQTEADALARTLKDNGNKKLSDDVQILANTAGLNYETVSRDLGSRSENTDLVAYKLAADGVHADKSELRLLSLPSTGRPDMVYVLNSAINSPGYADYKGVTGKVFRAQDEDTIANWAARAPAKETAGQLAAVRAGDNSKDLKALLEGANTDEKGKIDKKKVGRALDAIEKLSKGKGEVAVIDGFAPDPNDPDTLGPMVLFRVKSADGKTTKLIDASGAVYDDYESYKRNNELPTDQNLLLPENLMTVKVALRASSPSTTATRTPCGSRSEPTSARARRDRRGGALRNRCRRARGHRPVRRQRCGVRRHRSEGPYERGQHNQDTSWSDPVGRQNRIMIGASLLAGPGVGLKAVGGLSTVASTVPRVALVGRGLGTAASGLGNGAFLGQFGHSTYMAVRNWDNLTPAQRRDFYIDTTIGAVGFAGGAVRTGKGVRAGVESAGSVGGWPVGPKDPAPGSRTGGQVLAARDLSRRWRVNRSCGLLPRLASSGRAST